MKILMICIHIMGGCLSFFTKHKNPSHNVPSIEHSQNSHHDFHVHIHKAIHYDDNASTSSAKSNTYKAHFDHSFQPQSPSGRARNTSSVNSLTHSSFVNSSRVMEVITPGDVEIYRQSVLMKNLLGTSPPKTVMLRTNPILNYHSN